MHAIADNSTIICGDDVYGGTFRIFSTVFHEKHKFHFLDTTDLKKITKSVEELKPKLIWLETPTNPMMRVSDLAAAAELGRDRGITTVVDNTFASPYNQRPLELGIDVVVHSTTKYLNGHSDVVGGMVLTSADDWAEHLYYMQKAVGAVPGPMDCWLTLRGTKTLAVRMEAHNRNGLAIARFLESHPKVEGVYYPGLESHPQHQLAVRQMLGFTGMISIELGGMALYAKGASETSDEELKTLFTKLAEMEQHHLSTLSARYHVDAPKLDDGGIGVAQIAVYGEVEVKAKSAEELLELALRLEERARDFFAEQARSLEEGSAEWRLYRELEAEEWEHVALIDTELRRFREGRVGAL